jgi:hypothetical protein
MTPGCTATKGAAAVPGSDLSQAGARWGIEEMRDSRQPDPRRLRCERASTGFWSGEGGGETVEWPLVVVLLILAALGGLAFFSDEIVAFLSQIIDAIAALL